MKIPASTYRIQMNYKFTFNQTKNIVSYLRDLGVSDIYASPILRSVKGSSHGYDSLSAVELNPELGSDEEFASLAETVQNAGLGWLQDIVPNHMACNSQNNILMDILESGKNSIYYNFFDIDWDHTYESIKGRLLIPFLGDFYSNVLERGEIKLSYDQKGFMISYYESQFPVSIDSYAKLLTYKFNRLKKKLGDENPDFIKLLGILYVLKTLSSKDRLEERFGQVKFVKNILWELYQNNDEIRKFLDKNISAFNGEPGNPESFDLLDNLLSEQMYRLSYWKVSNDEINYRRFFCVNQLISLKVEEKPVFNYVHSFIFELMKKGYINSLRVDHIDGLSNPTAYINNIRESYKDTYVAVEKILEFNEDLPEEWDIQGTTGYDFMNKLNGIFCKTDNEEKFSKLYKDFTNLCTTYNDLMYKNKKLMIENHMTGDVDNLAHLLKKISSRYRHGNDITLTRVHNALVEILSLFPVYRTYITPENFLTANYDYIHKTVEQAINKTPDLKHELNFIKHFLTYNPNDHLTDDEKNDRIKFRMRFQQFTGPIMAKGVEDTVLYIYNRLLSLNEVGGKPDKFGLTDDEFHNFNLKKLEKWPNTMNSTATHDTKRGEDTRARINVLSEIPDEWETNIKRWNEINNSKKTLVNQILSPVNNDEYLIYQTLIGTFPFYEGEYSEFVTRIKEYAIKAFKEAKVYTEWIDPNPDYEKACTDFIDKILEDGEDNLFKKELYDFQKKISFYGVFNSLSQTLLKICSPGVTDIYQGAELWDLSMVDPDNRRDVDFEKRKVYLEEIKNKSKNDILKLLTELSHNKEDGKIKLFLTYKALKAKNENIELFQNGEYIPLHAEGKYADHIIAFARKLDGKYVIAITPRFLTEIISPEEYTFAHEVWENTELILPDDFPDQWNDYLSEQDINNGNRLNINNVFLNFPVAMLINK